LQGQVPGDVFAVIPSTESPNSMKYSTPFFAGIAMAATLTVMAPETLADGYKIENPRARPSLGVAKNTAAFFTIHNNTGKADKLVSAEGTVSRKVELHTHLKENGVFKMRQVPHIDIPANGMVELKSGGLHVMVIGVHSPLKVGDKFKLKLNFEHAKPMTITVPVKKMTGHMMHMKMDHKKMKGMKMDHKKMDHKKMKAPAN